MILARIENARVQLGSEQALQHGGQSSRTGLGVAGLDMFSGTNSIAVGYVVCRARSPHSRCSSSLASPGQFIVPAAPTIWAGPMTTSSRPREPQWDGSRVGGFGDDLGRHERPAAGQREQIRRTADLFVDAHFPVPAMWAALMTVTGFDSFGRAFLHVQTHACAKGPARPCLQVSLAKSSSATTGLMAVCQTTHW